MKKILLGVIALFGCLMSKAQERIDHVPSKKLQLEEVNLVSSYYKQNGDNSAVMGGTGSEKLTDFSNTIDVILLKHDKKSRKNKFTLDFGIDHYTSASSDMIDLKANSSASSADTRIYPSISWSRENEAKRNTILGGVSYSSEYDYQSVGANIGYSKKTANKMGEVTARFQTFIDQVSLVTPVELRPNNNGGDDDDYGTEGRKTFALSLSYAQIINKDLQLELMTDFVSQSGYLSLPFHRVYFMDGSVHQETLPDSRFKFPVGMRANYFIGDHVILRSYYRFYMDDWGLKSHTINLELPVKLSPFISLSPFYRFYNQSGTKYFDHSRQHTISNEFYTNNYDLSSFNSHFYGAGVRINPKNGLFGIQRLSKLEIRYGHYTKSVGMVSDIISFNLRYK